MKKHLLSLVALATLSSSIAQAESQEAMSAIKKSRPDLLEVALNKDFTSQANKKLYIKMAHEISSLRKSKFTLNKVLKRPQRKRSDAEVAWIAGGYLSGIIGGTILTSALKVRYPQAALITIPFFYASYKMLKKAAFAAQESQKHTRNNKQKFYDALKVEAILENNAF